MIKTLRYKFIAIAMCSITLVLTAIVCGINAANYRNVCKNADQRIAMISLNDGTFPDNPGRDKPNPPLSPEAFFDTRYFTVTISDDGAILSVNTGKIAAASSSDAAAYAASLWKKHRTTGFIHDYRYRAVPALSSSGEHATMYIFLHFGRELGTFRSFLLASIGISLLGLFLVLGLVVFFSKKAIAPVSESYEKQKRFITDASHELKTPLAVIEANTEVTEMESGETQWTKSTKNQVARLTALTEKLVFLSRIDEEGSALDMHNFNLSAAMQEAAEPFSALALARDRRLCVSIQPDITTKGDEAAIRQLVSLLLDNAIKYSTPHSTIELTLQMSGRTRSKTLTVRNAVEAVEPGRHEELFERFYRRDASRNSHTGGFGIGLSVAKAIVTAHKGRLTAKSDDGHSLTFTATLY